MSENVVTLAAEFPNDNPALHAGTSWICVSVIGPPIAELSVHRARIPIPLPVEEAVPPTLLAEADEAIVVEDLEPVEAKVEGVVPIFESIAPPTIPSNSSALPPPSDDPFTTLVCAIADVAIGAGSPHVASILPGLLFDGRVAQPMDEHVEATLRAGGVWNGSEIDPAFLTTVQAWRAILCGTSEDFSECGMLDEWASDLLARLLEGKATKPKLRQELRSRGIAAFGLAA